MPPALSIQDQSATSAPINGPQPSIRRFWAGMRIVIALLVATLIFSGSGSIDNRVLAIMTLYFVWSAWVLWAEANGRIVFLSLWTYWIDVIWSCLIMTLWREGAMMMTLTLIYPVVLATIGFGVRHGLLLALLATAGLLLSDGKNLTIGTPLGWQQNAMLLLMLGLVPAVALVSRPMGIRLRGLSVLGIIQSDLDPRRGLEPMCAKMVERLRQATQADVVALVLPSKLGAPAMLADKEDGHFRASAQVHSHLELLLSKLPICPITHIQRAKWDPRPGTQYQAQMASTTGFAAPLSELSQTLNLGSLYLVPLTRYGHQHGHLLVGSAVQPSNNFGVMELMELAPELLRNIEQATLVDQVQEESTSHERARIGRDLHDSAIQPYLGLKYAVESVALGIPATNPARASVDSLAELVNSEVSSLRELISGLRTGNEHGDSALIPAIRRQLRRFSTLFGIDIDLDCPASLSTTRAMAGSLFHLINEVLNNIRKHTSAKNIWITITVEDGLICIVVRDDSGSILGRPAANFHPTSLSERAAELNGTLEISCPDGLNTTLVIQIPYKQVK